VSRTRSIVATLVHIGLLACATAAAAQTGDAAAKGEAQALVDQGLALAGRGDHRRALERFRAAYDTVPSAKILLNIGTTLVRLDRNAEAIQAYEKYLADPAVDTKRRAEVQNVLADLARKVGRIRVRVEPADAAVDIDGTAVQVSGGWPHLATVDPGRHTVSAAKPGFASRTVDVDVSAGNEYEVTITLTSEAAAAGDAAEPAAGEGEEADAAVSSEPVARRGGLGGLVGVHVDGESGGGGAVAGVAYGLGTWLDVSAAAIVGPERGALIAARMLPINRAVSPTISMAAVAFFVDGVTPGFRVAAGLAWALVPRLNFTLEVGIERYFGAPDEYRNTLFVPSLSAIWRI
jgi:hypothetical protein